MWNGRARKTPDGERYSAFGLISKDEGRVSRPCKGEFALEEAGDHETTFVAEGGVAGPTKVLEDADSEIGGARAVTHEEAIECAACPGKSEPITIEEEGLLKGLPLHREELERVAKPGDGISEVSAASVECFLLVTAK